MTNNKLTMYQLLICKTEKLYQQLEYRPNHTEIISKHLYQDNRHQIFQLNQLISNQQSLTQSSYSLFNNVLSYSYRYNDEEAIFKRVLGKEIVINSNENYTKLPLFFDHNYTIKIPKKVERLLRRYLPKSVLKEIDDDFEVAIELCLLMLTRLNSTYFEIRDDASFEGWKSLKAEFLRDFLSTGSLTYKKVREALEYPFSTGRIIECDYKAIEGEKCFNYRLGKSYINKGFIKYQLKTNKAKELLDKSYLRTHKIACANPICSNLIMLYPRVTLPSLHEIEVEARKLVKNKFKTKKGKLLKFRGKHPNSYFKNPKQISFVEDSIEIFKYLTENGLMIPIPGSDESGGRIVDSFTLMPSWIRSLVKIEGVPFVECDFTCLHPNIAISIYGGNTTFLKHQDITDAMQLDPKTVKQEHLSFFNKPVWQMKQSPLFDFYKKQESSMIDNIIFEKYNSKQKHKSTSRKMFCKEVEIMKDVIQQLNKLDIYVGYVYDALLCHPNHAFKVSEIMNSTAIKYKINTTAKVSDPQINNQLGRK